MLIRLPGLRIWEGVGVLTRKFTKSVREILLKDIPTHAYCHDFFSQLFCCQESVRCRERCEVVVLPMVLRDLRHFMTSRTRVFYQWLYGREISVQRVQSSERTPCQVCCNLPEIQDASKSSNKSFGFGIFNTPPPIINIMGIEDLLPDLLGGKHHRHDF